MSEEKNGFFETRAGLVSAWRRFADEPTPRRRAWLFTLGSAALLTLVVQLVTGIALAMYYAPTPDHAHASVRALQTSVPGGALVRGLHHWGSSAIVLLVALHLFRTFWFGAYKKPRELNWVVGVALLLLVLGFGFTGYLLPWDQKAYWATVVGTKAPSTLPVVGQMGERMLAGGPRIGAYTLTRFYALHVIVLPLVTLLLVVAHLVLLRRHGHAGPASGRDPREPFFPYQLARDAAVGLVVVTTLFWLALHHPAPLERIADPADTTYVPRPEWYFLPLFQLLKYFQGPLEPVGTAILPGLAVLLLALLPWLDRAGERRARARIGVLISGSAVAVGVLALLYLGAKDRPKPAPSALDAGSQPPPDPRLLGGLASYERRGCASCHGPDGRGGAAQGFALAGRRWGGAEDRLTAHVRKETPPPTEPTPAPGEGEYDPDKDIPSLIAFVGALREGPLDLSPFPPAVVRGGAAIDREDCRSCHQLYGEGGKRGPELSHISGRRDEVWLVGHFREPKKYVPLSKMPSFKDLPEADLSAMARYLLALP